MERKCKICKEIKKTPYKDICRKCYQVEWLKIIPEKICITCSEKFKNTGKICPPCARKERIQKKGRVICLGCQRKGMCIVNQTKTLCTRCDRHIREKEIPGTAEKRRDYHL